MEYRDYKRITLKQGTLVHDKYNDYEIKETQTFDVVSETEATYFFKFENILVGVAKGNIHKVDFPHKKIDFHSIKKEDIGYILKNYNSLLERISRITSRISTVSFTDYDLSEYKLEDIKLNFNEDNVVAYVNVFVNEDIPYKKFQCIIPMEFLWTHNYKSLLYKYYGKEF